MANDLSPVTLLLQEIQSLTSSMRRNQRWANTSSSSSFASSSAPLPTSLRTPGRKTAGSRRKGRPSDGEQGDLMVGFIELKRSLSGVKDITTLDPYIIIAPFIALVRSPLTSGPITSLSLASLHSLAVSILPLFFTPPPTSSLPSPATPLQIALTHLTSALSTCRFPSSSPQQDELVLLRLLRVIETLTIPLSIPGSSHVCWTLLDHMSDESVCELLEVGLGMLARARLTEGLRNAAGVCVAAITRQVFGRLKTLDKEDVEKLIKAMGNEEKEKTTQVKVPPPDADAELGAEEKDKDTTESKQSLEEKPKEESETAGRKSTETVASEATPMFTPYGLPTVLELLRVLIALLNPSDQAHTDSMRLSALSILNTALEVGGSSLGEWSDLREGVRDEGCRYLFQLTRSDSPALLAPSLRTTSTLFSTLLPHLKPQLELFLSYLIDRLTPPNPSPIPFPLIASTQSISRPSTPGTGIKRSETPLAVEGDKDPVAAMDAPTPLSATPRPLSLLPPVPAETKELMLDTLTQIALRDSFMVDCWVNFDCSLESEDIFERLLAFLTRGVYPAGTPKQDGSTQLFEGLENVQLLSLEILLEFINSMADRQEHAAELWSESYPSVETLSSQKSRKGLFLQGAALFNQKPKTGLAFLEKSGIIAPDPNETGTEEEKKIKATAQFLRNSSRLDKKLLGEFISRPDQIDLLKAFIGLFDFEGKSIADAMREMLETFRLPGEASPIARITETFAEHFFSFKPPEIASQDAVYVLAYSVIMLNTDLHNPQNRKRMTIDDYKRNLRGVNDGKDFDPEYLANIHDSLRKREIILPEEHAGQHGFDYAWKSLMQRSKSSSPMISCNTSTFDGDMFRLAWRPLISAIAFAFTMSAGDDHVLQKAITGFRQCASLASTFQLPEVFDTIVLSLAGATGLLESSNDSKNNANFPSVEKDGQSLTVSPLSIRFGQSYRAQLATVVLFTILNGNGSAIRNGWVQIFEMFETLFIHSLLPTPMLQMEDFLAGTTSIPMKISAPAPVAERRPEGGLLSTLSSYLLSPYGGSSDALVVIETSDEDVENTLVAVETLGSCKLEELYAEILALDIDALVPALRAIRHLAEERTTARLLVKTEVRSETGSPVLVPREGQLEYDPACVFHLETMVSLACRGKQHIAETWPIIFEYIETLLNSAQSYSVLLIERAVVGLLRLCLIVSETPELRDQLYLALDVLRSLPSSVLNAVSEQLMAGVARILDRDNASSPPIVRSQTEWGLIIALFRATVSHPEASKTTLEIVQKIVEGKGGLVLGKDNFEGVVALLDEFATAAGAAAAGRGRGGKDSRRTSGTPTTLGPTVERGLTALDSLYELRNVIPGLLETSKLSGQEGFNAFWLPPLLVISKQTVNAHLQIRQRAINHLQRLLLSPQLLSGDDTILPVVFDRVLFPIMDELLKPNLYDRNPGGYGETRLRAATLLCKVFLQYVVRLVEVRGDLVGVVFVGVLDKLERFMRGERDILNEAGESLKNVVLVMHSSGLLLPPPTAGRSETRTQEQIDLWNKSAERIERILPGFLGDAMAPRPDAAVGSARDVGRKSLETTKGGKTPEVETVEKLPGIEKVEK